MDTQNNIEIAGMFLLDYDPTAHDGYGSVTFTETFDQAKKFWTLEEAQTYVALVPHNRPLDDDGLPNRPLCAFTLEFVEMVTLH